MHPDLVIFVTELARRQFVRREALRSGFVEASRLLTFTRLREACVEAAIRSGLLDARELTPVRRLVLVRAVAAAAGPGLAGGPLAVLSPSALADTLESLVEGLSPFGDDAEPIQEWLAAQPAGTKLAQLGRLYGAYRAQLARARAVDTRDTNAAILRLLDRRTEDWPAPLARAAGRVVFRAMRWLNPFEEKFVMALKRRLGDDRVVVHSALPGAHAEKVEDRLSARVRSDVMMGAGEAWSAWAEGLGDALEMEDPRLALDSRDRISFSRSAGLYGEVEDLARRIRWEMDRGVAPDQIALVVRNVSDYADAITHVFRRFQIPSFFRRGLPAASLPLVKALLSLLSLPLAMERDRLCALLQVPGLRWQGLGTEEAKQEAAHSLLAAGAGPRLAVEQVRQRLAAYHVDAAPDRKAGRDAMAKALLQHIARLRSLASPAPLAGHVQNALKLAEELGFREAAAAAPAPAILRAANQRALEAALDTLREIADAAAGDAEPSSLADLVDLLEVALDNTTIPAAESTEGGVWVLNPFDTAGLRFDVVLLAGLNEGVFPAVPRQDSLFSDPEREAIRKAMADRKVHLPQWSLPLSTLRLLQESVLFLISIGMARERLVLSYQACDSDGRELVPSDFLRSLWNLAGYPAHEKLEPDDYDQWRIRELGAGSWPNRHLARQQRTAPYQRTPMPGESYLATVPLPLCRAADEARQRVARAAEDPAAAIEIKALSSPEVVGRGLPPSPGFGGTSRPGRGGAGGSALPSPPPANELGTSLCERLEIEQRRERFFDTPGAQRHEPEPYCGRLESRPVRAIAGAWTKMHEELSATALEALARCRYRFLLSQVLRLGPLRTLEDVPDLMDRGRVIHRALELLYGALAGDTAPLSALDPALPGRFAQLCQANAWAVEQKNGEWALAAGKKPSGLRVLPLVSFDASRAGEYQAFTEAMAEAFFRYVESGDEEFRLGDPGVWSTEKPKILQVVRNYVRLDLETAAAERRFPALFELRFGRQFDGAAPDTGPLQLARGDRRIAIHGQADRLDLLFDAAGRLSGLLVLDYKTPSRGGKSHSEKKYAEEIAENLDCQLPIYGFVAQQFLFGRHNLPELNAMTEVLYHIQDREYAVMLEQFEKRRVHLNHVLEAGAGLTEAFFQRLEANLARLGEADFSVDPLDCTYCDFKHICRVDVRALEGAEGS